jgi:hypothetical protein
VGREEQGTGGAKKFAKLAVELEHGGTSSEEEGQTAGKDSRRGERVQRMVAGEFQGYKEEESGFCPRSPENNSPPDRPPENPATIDLPCPGRQRHSLPAASRTRSRWVK